MAVSNFETETRVCSEHGQYIALLTPAGWSGCSTCGAAALRADVRAAEQANADASRMRRAGIPERFFRARLGNFNPPTPAAELALKVAQHYAGDFPSVRAAGQCLILCGNVGTGKTHLAIGVMHQVMALGCTARYAVMIDVARAVKETYRKDSVVTESAVLERFIAPDLLVLDEIGMQVGSDTEKMITFSIINSRYSQMRPTIVISNLAMPLLKDFLTERVMDRMRDGGGLAVAFDWDSYRRAA
ncbi:hypothetical protein BAU08_05750 [Bordetella bronchialis]|uniref:AAA+ ATPase domain-containing protein n=2 Tax=Bordetella bronchialis TaxID=463025 RepID=A0A193G4G6_9BORD|nr:hypothetical protein BAU08_05750 [Bordetella bronchialis]